MGFAVLKRSVELDPNVDHARFLLSLSYAMNGERGEALQHYAYLKGQAPDLLHDFSLCSIKTG